MASSPAQFRSLVDGELDVALTSPDNVLAYRFNPRNPLGGAGRRIVAAIDRGMAARRSTAAPGHRAGDLRGAGSVSTSPPRASRSPSTRWPTRSGSAATSTTLVALGSTPRRLEALLGGRLRRHDAQRRQRARRRGGGVRPAGRVADVCRPTSARCVAVAARPPRRCAARLAGRCRHRGAGRRWRAARRRGGRGGGPAPRPPDATSRAGTCDRLRDPRRRPVPRRRGRPGRARDRAAAADAVPADLERRSTRPARPRPARRGLGLVHPA